jgi:hypothetical protein
MGCKNAGTAKYAIPAPVNKVNKINRISARVKGFMPVVFINLAAKIA